MAQSKTAYYLSCAKALRRPKSIHVYRQVAFLQGPDIDRLLSHSQDLPLAKAVFARLAGHI
jgi:hypothetical protein